MKRLLCILTLLCVLAGLCVLPLSAAEGNVTVRYGAEDLSLTLIDPLDDAGLTFDGKLRLRRCDRAERRDGNYGKWAVF